MAPDQLTRMFRALAAQAGLPWVYLTDPGDDTPSFLTALCSRILPKRQFRMQCLQRVTATSA